MENMMLRFGIGYNTLLNTSTSHIAEMIIKGSNNGVLEMEKVLAHNEEVCWKPLPQSGEGTDRDGECQHPDSERISIAYKTTAFGNLTYIITHKLYTCIPFVQFYRKWPKTFTI